MFMLAFTFGLAITALTYPISMMGGLLQAALGIFGLLGGPVLGVFTLGMFFPNANKHVRFASYDNFLVLVHSPLKHSFEIIHTRITDIYRWSIYSYS